MKIALTNDGREKATPLWCPTWLQPTRFSDVSLGTKRLTRRSLLKRSAKLSRAVRELDENNLPQPVAEMPWAHNRIPIRELKGSLPTVEEIEKELSDGR